MRSHGQRWAKEEIIAAAPHADETPETRARSLLKLGYAVNEVATRTGLSVEEVAVMSQDHADADVSALVKHVNSRLRDLGMSVLAASKLGKLSRSTLATLGKGGKVPSDATLDKLDELLSWERGSARATMFGAEPVPRETPDKSALPPVDNSAEDDYVNLASQIELRLRELNMSKSKFAAIGGPGRSTLATLGKRGYQPAQDTLDRIDRFLLWEPGSAAVVLKGGLPIRRGPTPTPHPSLIPLNAVLDRLRRMLAPLSRYEQGIGQMKTEVNEAINHVALAVSDLEDLRRGIVPTTTDDTDSSDDDKTRDAAEHHSAGHDDADD
jgi:hypothetical protein